MGRDMEMRVREREPATLGDEGASAVEIVGATRQFGPVVAVNEVSLSVRRGEVLTLLGPSGCGKTTLLNMIAGFELPDSGFIRIDGRDVTEVPPYQRDTGMVFQNYALFPHMTVFENVAFGLRMRGLPAAKVKDEVGRALEMVKLSGLGERRIRQLSGGQQQRIALARAIVIRPKVLLLDEPLSALDKNLRGQMQVELKELHQKTGLTTVFVTHDQGEALSLSDRVVVMNRGEIQQVSTPIELYRNPVNSFVASFVGEINRLPPARHMRRGRELLLEFPQGVQLVTSAPPRDFEEGRKVHIFVRPENVTIVPAVEDLRPNVVRGRVVTHIYQGSHTVTRVEVTGLGPIELRMRGGEVMKQAPVGANVGVEIDLSEAVFMSE
ncbi:MAG TPA: ABC transporter ATP-binding protein [Alphaproteobacteria bacterium]|nr:ABC transporter ATP-binding protein [Alphaproteobacteria bacterium]